MTRDTRLRVAVGVLSTAGIAVAAYLSYGHATDTALLCPTSGCGKVQQSSYSELAGVPVAYVGVIGYVAILATALTARRTGAVAGALLAVLGAAFALYLLVAQVAFVHAVCTWCVTSDAILALLVAVAAMRAATEGRRKPALRIRS